MKRERTRSLAIAAVFTWNVLVAPAALLAAPPSAKWAWSVTKTHGDSSLVSVAVDEGGNIYAAGYITGAPTGFDFGNGVTIKGLEVRQQYALLVRFQPNGSVKWARSPVSADVQSGFSSAGVDSSGNIYAVGTIGKGRVDFGNGVTATGIGGSSNAILVKFNPAGVAQWARTVTAGTGDSEFSGVAVDRSGTVFVGGFIGEGVYKFGPDVSATGGPSSGGSWVLLQYDLAGTARWARSVPTGTGATWSIGIYGMTADPAGSVYVAGYCGSETFDFGNGVKVKAAGAAHALLVKYDRSGAAMWARISDAGMASFAWFYSVAVDSSGDILASGGFMRNVEYRFGGDVRVEGALRNSNPVLVKYDAQGGPMWARTAAMASTVPSQFTKVCTDAGGNPYVTVWSNSAGTLEFEKGVSVELPAASVAQAAVLVKYDASGTPQWVTPGLNAPMGISYDSLVVDANGNLVVVGWIGVNAVEISPGVTAGSKDSSARNALLVKF